MSLPQQQLQSLLSAIIDRYNDVGEDDVSAQGNKDETEDDSSFSSIDPESARTSHSLSISSTSSGGSSGHENAIATASTNTNTNNKSIQNEVNVSFYISQSILDGKKHVRKCHPPTSLVMSDMSIYCCGDGHNELAQICSNVIELDISKNQIADWNEVAQLLHALGKLRLLNLSFNPLSRHAMCDLDAHMPHTHTLHTLILNGCHVELPVVEALLTRLPQLQELHLSSNAYHTVNFSNKLCMPSMRTLYFNQNALHEWSDVCKLGRAFPRLENLVISHNQLANFSPVSNPYAATHHQLRPSFNSANATCFAHLQILTINALHIREWTTLDQLREFPKLKHVRIKHIPLLSEYAGGDEELQRDLLVAYLHESITILNGSQISGDERENCERKYIRHYMEHAEAARPKRYYELERKHGKLNKLADVNLDIGKQVSVKIKFGEKQMMERIGVKQTVGAFKRQLEKFVGQPASRFKLYYIDIEACSMSVYGPEELKYPNRCLHSFNIRDGDEFEIDLKRDAHHHHHHQQQQHHHQHHCAGTTTLPAPFSTSSSSPTLSSASKSRQQHQHQQQQQQQQQQPPQVQHQQKQLHHLHMHHYNSHINNNSLHQIPMFDLFMQNHKKSNEKINSKPNSSSSSNSTFLNNQNVPISSTRYSSSSLSARLNKAAAVSSASTSSISSKSASKSVSRKSQETKSSPMENENCDGHARVHTEQEATAANGSGESTMFSIGDEPQS